MGALQLEDRIGFRAPIVAAVLVLSAAGAYVSSVRETPALLALLGAAAATVAFHRWPPVGLAALIAGSLLVPMGFGPASAFSLPVLLLPLLTALWILRAVRERRLGSTRSSAVVPLFCFAAVSVLAFASGTVSRFALAETAPLRAQLGGLAIFLLSGCAFLLMARQVESVALLRRLTWLFLAIGSVYVAGRLTPGIGNLVTAPFRHGGDGSLFWTWLVALAFAQAVFNRDLPIGWRIALAALVAAALYIGLFEVRWWASGWLPPIVAIAVSLWLGAPRIAFALTLVVGALVVWQRDAVVALIMVGDQDYSLLTRTEAWTILTEIIRVNPILGLGPANYYHYTALFPILGWYVSFSSHNNYVDIVAQTGFLGLFCFLWFFAAVGRAGLRLRGRVSGGFERAYVYGALGGLVGTLAAGMMADWVLPFVYNIGISGFRSSVLAWLFLGGLIALERLSERPVAAAGAASHVA